MQKCPLHALTFQPLVSMENGNINLFIYSMIIQVFPSIMIRAPHGMINLSSLLIHFKLKPDNIRYSALWCNAGFLCILHFTYTKRCGKNCSALIIDKACFECACRTQLRGQHRIRSCSNKKRKPTLPAWWTPIWPHLIQISFAHKMKLYLTCVLRNLLAPVPVRMILCPLSFSTICSGCFHVLL